MNCGDHDPFAEVRLDELRGQFQISIPAPEFNGLILDVLKEIKKELSALRAELRAEVEKQKEYKEY